MARSHAPPAFPAFARYGTRLPVTWHPADAVSAGTLHGAIVAGLALAQRKQSDVDPGEALQDVEQRVVREVERLAKMDRSADRICCEADTITDEVRKGTNALTRVVDKAKQPLRALNIEVGEEAEETSSSIATGCHLDQISIK